MYSAVPKATIQPKSKYANRGTDFGCYTTAIILQDITKTSDLVFILKGGTAHSKNKKICFLDPAQRNGMQPILVSYEVAFRSNLQKKNWAIDPVY